MATELTDDASSTSRQLTTDLVSAARAFGKGSLFGELMFPETTPSTNLEDGV